VGAKAPEEVIEAAAFETVAPATPDLTPRSLIVRAGEVADEPSPEEAIRAFGRLVREGALRQRGEGEFVLSEASAHLALARRGAVAGAAERGRAPPGRAGQARRRSIAAAPVTMSAASTALSASPSRKGVM
jgi:hypothetical protein